MQALSRLVGEMYLLFKERGFILNHNNIRNYEIALRDTLKQVVKEQKRLLSKRQYKEWRKDVQETYKLRESD